MYKRAVYYIIIILLSVSSCSTITNLNRKKVIYTLKYKQQKTNIIPTEVLRKRFEYFGLKKSKFTYLNNRLIVKVFLKSFSDTVIVTQLITNSGNLMFLEVYRPINNMKLYKEIATIVKSGNKNNNLITFHKPSNYTVSFLSCNIKYASQVRKIFSRSIIHNIIPKDARFLFTKPEKEIVDIILIKNKGLVGDVVEKATYKKDKYGNDNINISLKPKYHKNWEDLTKSNINKPIAIVFDNIVYSYPVVNSIIKGGKLVITGLGDSIEFKLISCILNSGIIKGKFTVEKITNE